MNRRISNVEMKTIFLAFAVCLIPYTFCLSQTVTIKGKADSSYLSSANTIDAYTYDDYISYREKELASSKLDEKGNFILSFSISEPTYIYLMVDNAKAEMVCEPNKTYDITFLTKDSDAVNTLSIAVPAELEFNNSNKTELNYLLADFSNRYESFLEDHRGMIAKKESAIFGKIDTMKTLFKKKYYLYNNSYLNNHIEYTFASLVASIALKGDEKVFNNYIEGKPIQLGNYDYMTFLNQFYSSISNSFMNNSKTQTEVEKQIFSSLKDYYKQNKFIANDSICEMVILKSLAEYSRYPSAYKINAVLAILEQASKQCKSEANRRSAENLKKKLSVMNVGKPAPQLFFQNMDGKSVSLSNFKGKYVYLTFWASWSATSTQELTLIPELKKLYGSKITFVSICIDKKQETMKVFLQKNPKLDTGKNGAGWNFLYCDNYKKAKEEFNVLAVPTYFMLDPKGNVYKSPAPNPIDIEPVFIKIKKKQQ
ncbi:MAG: TlpA family protein disulfide reductase [Bacteroidetes bacterium]|nr:TlpA family protein disulfide reductase [Bacteroidota bacterium]